MHPGRGPVLTFALCAALATGACGSGNGNRTASRGGSLQAAADATAKAHSFTLSVAGADVVYQAPDRVQQVEHGQAMTASATNGASSRSSGPFPQTITKVFIGDQYYEAETPDGDAPAFTSSPRCANDQNAAEVVLGLLRAIAISDDVQASGDTYTFHIPDQGGNMPTSGTATVAGGFVRALGFTPSTETVTIDAVNNAPPVTAPGSSTPTNVSCN